jgi:hypothetical protein
VLDCVNRPLAGQAEGPADALAVAPVALHVDAILVDPGRAPRQAGGVVISDTLIVLKAKACFIPRSMLDPGD